MHHTRRCSKPRHVWTPPAPRPALIVLRRVSVSTRLARAALAFAAVAGGVLGVIGHASGAGVGVGGRAHLPIAGHVVVGLEEAVAHWAAARRHGGQEVEGRGTAHLWRRRRRWGTGVWSWAGAGAGGGREAG